MQYLAGKLDRVTNTAVSIWNAYNDLKAQVDTSVDVPEPLVLGSNCAANADVLLAQIAATNDAFLQSRLKRFQSVT